jgi:ribonuclease E
MLIDASHPEETRVVVLDGQKVEEFDFEAASKRPLKGNIYLAKVTRVEPSLQAAFVEYGGNRQGFLAFSEIHPDYYQIPVADRMALLAEQEAEARRRAEEEFEAVETAAAPAPAQSVAEVAAAEPAWPYKSDREPAPGSTAAIPPETPEFTGTAKDGGPAPVLEPMEPQQEEIFSPEATVQPEPQINSFAPESTFLGNETVLTEPEVLVAADTVVSSQTEGLGERAYQAPRTPQRWMRRRHYKIQEVIKRRQIILVQVVKEERGTKGAALTTYLSLAGRYCVLMPNTPRGGGISRKITSATDRKRLKTAAQSLELPEGMGLIIRTAGENRTKTEIKRDYEYLLRMWDTVRELTLKSNAPACVYEEGDLIKRAIRDLYNKDVAEIVVEGDEGYRNAKDFMRMLMPSHAKNVKQYKEPIPLLQRHHVEAQLDVMFSPTVTLRSGGYIVINQTEALVAIDVNSGRATREHSIEDTAYKTNLEAADEIARQLRLRDLAGLIVIDFIDMEDSRNDRNVEKRLRDSVKNDRARVQIGKISQFGLLEMSRQRLRAGVVAGSTVPCPNCGGQGIVRSVESTALRVLRSLEEEGQRQRAAAVTVRAPLDVAIYTLNQKRRELTRIESEYGMAVQFDSKDGIVAGTFEIERVGQKAPEDRVKHLSQSLAAPAVESVEAEPDGSDLIEEEDEEREESGAHAEPQETQQQQHQPEGKRKRRRRRRGRDHLGSSPVIREAVPTSALGSSAYREGVSEVPGDQVEMIAGSNLAPVQTGSHSVERPPAETSGRKRRRRRRGRRGPRDGQNAAQTMNGPVFPDEDTSPVGKLREPAAAQPASVESPVVELSSAVPNAPSEPVWSLSPEPDAALPEHRNLHAAHSVIAEPIGVAASESVGPVSGSPAEIADEKETEDGIQIPEESREPAQPPRRGWWQRPFRARE